MALNMVKTLCHLGLESRETRVNRNSDEKTSAGAHWAPLVLTVLLVFVPTSQWQNIDRCSESKVTIGHVYEIQSVPAGSAIFLLLALGR